MLKFTLDTNSLIDVADKRDNARYVLQLLDAHTRGEANLALVAASASERQQGEDGQAVFLNNFSAFNARRIALGFGDLELLPSIARGKLSFFNRTVISSTEGVLRENKIFCVLASGFEPEWKNYAQAAGVDLSNRESKDYSKWRNKLIDAQAFWAHEHAGRDVFVTRDKKFKRLQGHPDFPEALICTPQEAVGLL